MEWNYLSVRASVGQPASSSSSRPLIDEQTSDICSTKRLPGRSRHVPQAPACFCHGERRRRRWQFHKMDEQLLGARSRSRTKQREKTQFQEICKNPSWQKGFTPNSGENLHLERENATEISFLQHYKNNPPTGPTKYDAVRTTDLYFVWSAVIPPFTPWYFC